MSDSPSDDLPPTRPSSTTEMRAYMSDVLAQLADMADRLGDRRLECDLRLLALHAVALR